MFCPVDCEYLDLQDYKLGVMDFYVCNQGRWIRLLGMTVNWSFCKEKSCLVRGLFVGALIALGL